MQSNWLHTKNAARAVDLLSLAALYQLHFDCCAIHSSQIAVRNPNWLQNRPCSHFTVLLQPNLLAALLQSSAVKSQPKPRIHSERSHLFWLCIFNGRVFKITLEKLYYIMLACKKGSGQRRYNITFRPRWIGIDAWDPMLVISGFIHWHQ